MSSVMLLGMNQEVPRRDDGGQDHSATPHYLSAASRFAPTPADRHYTSLAASVNHHHPPAAAIHAFLSPSASTTADLPLASYITPAADPHTSLSATTSPVHEMDDNVFRRNMFANSYKHDVPLVEDLAWIQENSDPTAFDLFDPFKYVNDDEEMVMPISCDRFSSMLVGGDANIFRGDGDGDAFVFTATINQPWPVPETTASPATADEPSDPTPVATKPRARTGAIRTPKSASSAVPYVPSKASTPNATASISAGEDSKRVHKRQLNTEAARRSRARKREELDDLYEEISTLLTQRDEAQLLVHKLELERAGYVDREAKLERRVKDLECKLVALCGGTLATGFYQPTMYIAGAGSSLEIEGQISWFRGQVVAP